jgi:hypothetical protein
LTGFQISFWKRRVMLARYAVSFVETMLVPQPPIFSEYLQEKRKE